jgi:hypothetical protein
MKKIAAWLHGSPNEPGKARAGKSMRRKPKSPDEPGEARAEKLMGHEPRERRTPTQKKPRPSGRGPFIRRLRGTERRLERGRCRRVVRRCLVPEAAEAAGTVEALDLAEAWAASAVPSAATPAKFVV